MKYFITSLYIFCALNMQIVKAKVIFTDLGDNPILTLLCGSIVFGVIWGIGVWLEEVTDGKISCFTEILKGIGRIGCIGCLISIPINLLFMIFH